ncbi:MAG: flagellin [Candidatus Bathyarchaeota archaeon B24]|nr:MAG: flagellin [Candidatus Bathyarchaeota archaeon B24]
MKRCRGFRSRRGTIGVETAIVMIAFVVVASAVAYVIINMGFYAAQKSKETIGRGVDSASSSLELDGSVVGKVDSTGSYIEYLIIPVRLSVGKSQVDLDGNATMVSVYSDGFTLPDIYQGVDLTFDESTETDLTSVITGAEGAMAVIFNDDNDTILELNEKAFIVIRLDTSIHTLESYDTVKVEIKTGTCAALAVVRQIPTGLVANDYVDLG